MDENGVCKCCKEKLVCIDINPVETETFAASLTRLACEIEVRANCNQFQEWLERHGLFDAVIARKLTIEEEDGIRGDTCRRRNQCNPRPVTPDSLFPVFSVTKGVTDGMIQWLVDKGKFYGS
ncbi:PREDICTED: proteinaceous RNase P 1, chloroplastic/mitochondrial-like isoform X1 [Camelina sativa]|uniref:ribonuclease P n=1 Tax=Camelina sativa TaxID=90675 RepID=A0ABM0U3L4_CAMSA|nr:PREDICTED: proteinaceous RNase P 1, chloroplastic/mitochondrial-like isoform X1 [Camelina sativa]XP_010435304.1 PREDICTED: proteinaceous RNase P 1, chloroplastic/mitochondrial-like isoform X1 [Camelina sativa]